MQTTTELLVNYAAWKMTTGQDCGLESNMVKLVASENANKAADLGIQILGGMGYSADTDMQRYWRASRLWRIGPITNEMVRRGIADRSEERRGGKEGGIAVRSRWTPRQ